MSKLYKLTKETHELVKKLAKQEKVEIEIQGAEYIPENTTSIYPIYIYKKIEAPQIRQILKAFEGVLKKTFKEYNLHKDSSSYCKKRGKFISCYIKTADKTEQILLEHNLLVSRVLYSKWSDYENGAFHRGNEGLIEVLEELNQILKSKIN